MRITAGKHRYRKLFVPKSDVRPTFSKLKSSLFNICQLQIIDAHFLDLFAGAGGVGFEALSRGAKKVLFVEKERAALKAIRDNSALLEEEKNTQVMACDVFEALKKLGSRGETFDIIFADPPYGTKERSVSNQVLRLIDSLNLLNEGGELFLEDAIEASDYDLPLSTLKLKSMRRIGRSVLRQYIRF